MATSHRRSAWVRAPFHSAASASPAPLPARRSASPRRSPAGAWERANVFANEWEDYAIHSDKARFTMPDYDPDMVVKKWKEAYRHFYRNGA